MRVRKPLTEEQKSRKRAAVRAWRANNPEKARASNKAWIAKNREKKRAARNAWDAKNPEKCRSMDKAYRARNREKRRAEVRAWAAKNPERKRERKHIRRARLRNAYTEKLTDAQRVCLYSTPTCYLCGKDFQPGDKKHVDHIIALIAGGPHTFDNLALTHSTCNQQKFVCAPTPELMELARTLKGQEMQCAL